MRTSRLLAAAALAASAHAFPASAAPTACPSHFAGGAAPDLLRAALAPGSAELCREAFALLHSRLSRTALWSAERLTAASVEAGRSVGRVDEFHEEPDVAEADRAALSDYRGSGYDRGHLAPAADMPTAAAQRESFSLANMVPQDPGTNRGIWAGVEAEARKLATAYGEAYVVSGPVFSGSTLRSLKGRVAVPTHVYKAVYLPSVGAASAWLATNDGTESVRVLSVSELSSMIGIDPFPSVAAAVKAAAVALPMPRAKVPGGAAKAAAPEASGAEAGGSMAGDVARAAASAAWKAWRESR